MDMSRDGHEKATLLVEGMHCASCVGRVEKAIRDLNGVDSASVNLATNEARFEFDAKKLDLDTIRKAISNAGFEPREASVAPVDDSAKRHEKYLRLRNKVIVSWLFSAPVAIISMLELWEHEPWRNWTLLLLT